ncbi:MAG TPA: hypothetical protein VEY12_03395 [Thermoplasmata archaeon]|nr:hypothetical protein [Thermoplasmata archaeon]
MDSPGWGMCKLTKTDSPVLSLFLETQYVNEIAARGYALRPNLAVPSHEPRVTRPAGAAAPAARA